MSPRDLDVEFEPVQSLPIHAKRVGHKGPAIPLTRESHHNHSLVADDAEVYSTEQNESYVKLKRKKQVKLVHEGEVTLPKGTYRVRVKTPGESQFVEILREAGVNTPVDEFMRWISEGIRSVAPTRVDTDSESQFTEEELLALKRGGCSFALPKVDPVAETAARYVVLLHESIPTAEVAERLGVNTSRIRQQLTQRSMFGLKVDGEWRIPLFQFSNDRQIPGIAAVLRQLSEDLHPVEVWEWFLTPDSDLTIDDTAVTPLQWLQSGGDPQRAADIASDI